MFDTCWVFLYAEPGEYTGMGDRGSTPALYVTSHPGQLSLAILRG